VQPNLSATCPEDGLEREPLESLIELSRINCSEKP